MTLTAASAGRHLISACLLSTLTLLAYGPLANAQSSETKPAEPRQYHTFYLANATQQAANEVQTDLRNLLPNARIYYVESQHAVSFQGSAEDLAMAQRILADIDRPSETYRLTYTISETDAGKVVSVRHVVMVVVVGAGKSEVKLGNKIPIVIGSANADNTPQNSQVQYEDVGLSIEAALVSAGNTLELRSKVVQSSVADEKSNVGIQDPVLRQTVLEGQSSLVKGKPLVLGAIDIPGGTRSEEIEVVAEPVK